MEYAELLALSRLERIGYEREDLRAAAMCGADPMAFCFEPEPEMTEEQIFQGFTLLVGVDESHSGCNRRRSDQRQAADAGGPGAEEGSSEVEPGGAQAGFGSGQGDGSSPNGSVGSIDQVTGSEAIQITDWCECDGQPPDE